MWHPANVLSDYLSRSFQQLTVSKALIKLNVNFFLFKMKTDKRFCNLHTFPRINEQQCRFNVVVLYQQVIAIFEQTHIDYIDVYFELFLFSILITKVITYYKIYVFGVM